MAEILITGVSGYVGAALVPRLAREGHSLRGLTRQLGGGAEAAQIPLVQGDVLGARGLERALDGVEIAYYLIHAMEPAAGPEGFEERERRGAENFARAARRAGVRRLIYLGGPMPASGRLSRHLASRLAVEEILLGAGLEAVAFRASIVIGARSRSFRFLVRLIERLPVLAIPGWGEHRSSPVDERDAIELLARAADSDAVAGLSLDMRGPEIVSYAELIERIIDAMLISRPQIALSGLSLTPIASRIAAAIAGEEPELIGPLMDSLEDDLLPRDDRAAALLGVRLHSLDSAIEHALREWESQETLRAR